MVKGTVVTSIKVALVVGTILALINYGDRIFLRHDMRLLDWLKLALTYFVPYSSRLPAPPASRAGAEAEFRRWELCP